MKKPSLRAERLTDLTGDELRGLAGAATTTTASDGSCVCTPSLVDIRSLDCEWGVSDASCICTMGCSS